MKTQQNKAATPRCLASSEVTAPTPRLEVVSASNTSVSVAKLQADSRAMSTFLEALGGDRPHTFQTFGEGATKGKPGNPFTGTYGQCRDQLLTANREGHGIFVTVSQTDGKGRKKANITAPRALFLDFDGVEPDPEKLAMLPPASAVVQSKNGQHLYWFLTEGQPLAELEPNLKRLAEWMDADPACTDMSRVMRLPGSLHHKGEPFPVALVECDGDRRYSFAEVMAAVPLVQIPQAKATQASQAEPKNAMVVAGVNSQNFHEKLRQVKGASRLPWMTEAVRKAPEGDRNSLLNLAAFQAYGLTVQGLPWGWIAEQLGSAALEAGLDAAEVGTTLESARAAAEAKGQGQTRAQRTWARLEKAYGQDAMFDERSNFPSIKGKQPELDVERRRYIDAYGEDIGADPFALEFMTWLKSEHSVDPVKAYFDARPDMPTDLARQVFTELAEEMGLTDPYHVSVLTRHRIGMVARTYEPGCVMQWALGLKGDAGCGKSSYFESYGPNPENYQKVGAGLATSKEIDKDVWLGLLPAVVVDIDEIDTLYGASSFERLKSVLSASSVTCRAPYERAAKRFPLRFVWGFTSNSDTPLHDDGAGNRRYVTLPMKGTQADGARRQRYYTENRDLINAAAKSLYFAGEPWNLTEVEQAMQAVANEDSVNRSMPYYVALDKLAALEASYTKPAPALQCRYGFHIDQLNELCGVKYAAEKQDVTKALGERGWQKLRTARGGQQLRLWVPGSVGASQLEGLCPPGQVEEFVNLGVRHGRLG